MTAALDKTFTGRIERGFNLLGYHFGPEDPTLATRIIEEFVERALRLYAQDPVERLAASSRLGLYVWRWRSGGRNCCRGGAQVVGGAGWHSSPGRQDAPGRAPAPGGDPERAPWRRGHPRSLPDGWSWHERPEHGGGRPTGRVKRCEILSCKNVLVGRRME